MTDDLTPAQMKATEQIIKLLNLAAKNDNPNEAAAAAAKAQALLAQHNLDAATLDAAKGASEGKREKNLVTGGTRIYVRDLWRSVAELNFCLYWSQQFLTEDKSRENIYKNGVYLGQHWKRVMRRRHALIGKIVNVRSTIAMAGYLEQAIERMLTERVAEGDAHRHSPWAWAFRAGAAEEVCWRLAKERQLAVKRQKSEVIGSSGSALTLTDLTQREEDANNDFIHGEGWSAQRRAERAKDAATRQAMRAAYTAWAAANPKEAQAKFVFVDDDGKEWRYGNAPRYSGVREGMSARDRDPGGHAAGREAGKRIGLYAQAEGKAPVAGRLAGSKDIAL